MHSEVGGVTNMPTMIGFGNALIRPSLEEITRGGFLRRLFDVFKPSVGFKLPTFPKPDYNASLLAGVPKVRPGVINVRGLLSWGDPCTIVSGRSVYTPTRWTGWRLTLSEILEA